MANKPCGCPGYLPVGVHKAGCRTEKKGNTEGDFEIQKETCGTCRKVFSTEKKISLSVWEGYSPERKKAEEKLAQLRNQRIVIYSKR